MNKFFFKDISYIRYICPGLIVLPSTQLFLKRYRRLFTYAKLNGYAKLQKQRSRSPSLSEQTPQSVYVAPAWRHPALNYDPISQGNLFGFPNFISQLKRSKNENL